MEVQRVKVVLVGDESVGKTALINKWVTGIFSGDSSPTIGGSNQCKTIKVDNEAVSLNVWDTAGAERYRSLTPMYIKDAMAVMIVFDITKRSTFDNVSTWIKFVKDQGDIPIVVAGNKNDINCEEKLSLNQGYEFCSSLGCEFFATSAKSGENVSGAFTWLGKIAKDYFLAHGKMETNFDTSATENMKSSCC